MLKGKAAIVTGSTSGIGLGIARALAEAGCNIMLNGFGEASAIENEREQIVKDFGVRTAFNPADLSKPTEVVQMIEAATGELGQVDILVNNAGIQHTAPVEQFPIDRWDAVIAINLSSNFHAIRAVIPQMRKRNWGTHHQRRFDTWARSLRGKGRLCRRQTRRAWTDQGCSA